MLRGGIRGKGRFLYEVNLKLPNPRSPFLHICHDVLNLLEEQNKVLIKIKVEDVNRSHVALGM